jgi:autotransporter-associated beta strand protein
MAQNAQTLQISVQRFSGCRHYNSYFFFVVVLCWVSMAFAVTVDVSSGEQGVATDITTGSDGLTKTGSGTLQIWSAQPYTGATVISGGQIMLAGSGAISASSALQIASGASINLTGYFAAADINRTFAGLTGSGILYGSGGTVTINIASGSDSFSGDIQGGHGLIKSGGGTLVLSGSNSYSGGTVISGGTLDLDGGSVTGNITNDANLTIRGDLANAVSGTGSLTKTGANNASLWTANSYTGATVVEGGQLRLDGSGAISSSSVVQISSGAGFSATGVYKTSNDLTIAGLTGDGQFYNANGNLTVNKDSGTDIFSGEIAGGTGLTKMGAGDLALGGASSYTGTTTVNAGRLVLAHGSGLGAATTGTIVASGAQLRLNATNSGFTIGSEALTISGQGLVATVGGALRNAAGNNTYQGKITLAADASIGAAGGTSLTLDVASGDAIDLGGFNLTFDGAGTVQINDSMVGTGQISKIGNGDLVIQKSDLTATIKSNSVTVAFAGVPMNGTYAVLPGSLAVASLASSSVTGLGSGQTATIANSPNLVVQVSDAVTGPTFADAYPGIDMTDLAPNGLTYLVNYAFGGSSTSEAKLPEQITSDPAQLTLVAYVRTNDPSVSVAPERGSSLTNWSSDSITTNYLTDPSAPAGTEKRSYSTPISTNNPRMFLRLKTTHGP